MEKDQDESILNHKLKPRIRILKGIIVALFLILYILFGVHYF